MKFFRYSLRALFYAVTLSTACVLFLINRPYSALACVVFTTYVYYETRQNSLPDLTRKRKQASSEMAFAVIVLGLGLYLWQFDGDWQGSVLTGGILLFQAFAHWMESRSPRA